MIQVLEVEDSYDGSTKVFACKTIAENPKAILAIELMSRMAIVAAQPDGEDTAGRQKLKMQEPEEIVTRCCEIADKAYDAFQTRGWLVPMPVPKVPNLEQREKKYEERQKLRQAAIKEVVENKQN
jgi:hypothetical protein